MQSSRPPAPSSRFFTGPGGEFHYLDWGGSGPLLHLSHATGFCAGVYTPLAQRLSQSFTVLGMDDRGHGHTPAPADPRRLYDWQVFADDLAAFWGHLERPVIAMGHSRGAVASLRAALQHPHLVRALVLVDPTILPYSWMWWWYLAKKTGLAGRVPIAHRAARRRAVWPSREALAAAYAGKSAFATWEPGFLEGYLECGVRARPDGQVELACHPAWEARCFAVCSHQVWSWLSRLACPLLVIYGSGSDTFLPAAARRLARVAPGARLLPVAGASHFLPMEQPGLVARAVEEFMAGLEPDQASASAPPPGAQSAPAPKPGG